MKKPLKRHVDSGVRASEIIETPAELRAAIKDVFDNNSKSTDDVSAVDASNVDASNVGKEHKSAKIDSGFAEIVASIIKSQLGDDAKNINVSDVTEVYDPDKTIKKPIQKRQRRTKKTSESVNDETKTTDTSKTMPKTSTRKTKKTTTDSKKDSETKSKVTVKKTTRKSTTNKTNRKPKTKVE